MEAVEGDSMRDRGSGDVVGGKLNAMSSSDETEKFDAQRAKCDVHAKTL